MTRKRTSPIWTLEKEKMQKLLNDSSSFVEVLKELGLEVYSGNQRTLRERIKLEGLNVNILEEKRKELMKKYSIQNKTKIPLVDIMVENSNYYGIKRLKKSLVEEKLLNYACERCGNDGKWMGEKLVLQLEHKNGKSKDHRLENLCFLCPNCHTQTSTYAGKNSSTKKSRICSECGGATKGKGTKCRKCVCENQPKKFSVTKERLEKLLKKQPLTKIGTLFGVSDNAIRKRCKSMGIEIPKNGKGYWTKINKASDRA